MPYMSTFEKYVDNGNGFMVLTPVTEKLYTPEEQAICNKMWSDHIRENGGIMLPCCPHHLMDKFLAKAAGKE